MIKIEKCIKKYRGIPFQYGGLGDGGLDCIGFVYRFYEDLGVAMPAECEEANKENYADIYRRDANRADELLLKYFAAMPGEEVNPMELLAGDAIIVRNASTGHLFPAVYGGNNIAVTSFIASYVRAFTLSEKFRAVVARRVV